MAFRQSLSVVRQNRASTFGGAWQYRFMRLPYPQQEARCSMRIIAAITIAVLLSGCGGGLGNKSSIDRQARALNADLQADAERTARNIQVSGQTFRVAVVAGGSYRTVATDTTFSNFVLKKSEMPYALVNAVEPVQTGYRASDVEAAARGASGCRATFDAGVLAFVGGGVSSSDLSALSARIPNFKGWRTDLEC